MPWPIRKLAATIVRDTATVMIAAKVSVKLRARLDPVSRIT